MTEYPWNWFTNPSELITAAAALDRLDAPTVRMIVLDSYYITSAGTLVGIAPAGDTVNTDESLAGTTLKVYGPFTTYDSKSKVLTTADDRRIQLLRPETTKTLKERTAAWLKTLP